MFLFVYFTLSLHFSEIHVEHSSYTCSTTWEHKCFLTWKDSVGGVITFLSKHPSYMYCTCMWHFSPLCHTHSTEDSYSVRVASSYPIQQTCQQATCVELQEVHWYIVIRGHCENTSGWGNHTAPTVIFHDCYFFFITTDSQHTEICKGTTTKQITLQVNLVVR